MKDKTLSLRVSEKEKVLVSFLFLNIVERVGSVTHSSKQSLKYMQRINRHVYYLFTYIFSDP